MTPGPRRLQRRTVIVGSGAAVAGLAGAAGSRRWYRAEHVHYPLLSEAVAVTGETTRALVRPGSVVAFDEHTRVARAAPDAGALAAGQRSWMAAGASWTRASGRYSSMLRSALLDLRTLTLPGGVPVAGWSPPWRYVWPRDASFVAAALAAAGHPDDAIAILHFLQRVQPPAGRGRDSWFEARYRIDGSGSPDARPRQLDGTGWALWAVGEVVETLERAGMSERAASSVVPGLAPLVRRSTDLILAETDRPSGLPSVSPDYWEVPETVLTLGTAAPLLAGISRAAGLLQHLDDHPASSRAAAGATRLAAAVSAGFAPDGYPRHLHAHDPDAAVTFLLPPFSGGPTSTAGAGQPTSVAPGLVQQTEDQLRRSNGGLAPGVNWRRDGASWTPETALFALTAAATGDTTTATRLLDFLDGHRTTCGSLPEMVSYDGRAASVAPLAWTAAIVVLTLSRLASPATLVGQQDR
jgi:glucoamylase